MLSETDIREENIPSVVVPINAFLLASGSKALIPLTVTVLRTIHQILPRRLDGSRAHVEVGSLVLSAQVGSGARVRVNPISSPVILEFPVTLQSVESPVCVFWDFSKQQWDNEGVSLARFSTDMNSTFATCRSGHLTSFAVLFDVSGTTPHHPALSILTYIGCGISILCLLLTLLFLVCQRKELYEKVNYFVLFNLCIALLCGLIVFCAGIETATWNVIPCTVVSALLHYFFLAVFSWMLCEGITIYNLFVRVLGAHKRKWIYIFSAIGWGLPVPIVAVAAGVKHNQYYIRGSLDRTDPRYLSIRACWLSVEDGVIAAFVGPVLIIVLVNSVLLAVVLYKLWKTKLGTTVSGMTTYDEKSSRKLSLKLLKAAVILLPLLGMTWVVGLLSAIPLPPPGQVVTAALFLVLNTLQGVAIFFFHVVRNDKVWSKLTCSESRKLKKLKREAKESRKASDTTGTAPSSSSQYADMLKNNPLIARTLGLPDDKVASESNAAETGGVLVFENGHKD
jgi:hypothetical protein